MFSNYQHLCSADVNYSEATKSMGNYRKIIGLDYQAYWEFRKKKDC